MSRSHPNQDEEEDKPWTPEDGWPEDDEEEAEDEPRPRRLWIRRTVIAVLIAALFANVAAFWPQVYNYEAIRFLLVSNVLSQDERLAGYKRAVVAVSSGDARASGFHIGGGYIVTNEHVVDGGREITVHFQQETAGRAAERIGADEGQDLALLKLEGTDTDNLPVLPLAESWAPGDPVYIIGNPLFFTRVINKGTIEGLTLAYGGSQPVMAIDVPVFSGNSGSPIIDGQGSVVGVAYASRQKEEDGRTRQSGLAVPAEAVRAFMDTLGLGDPSN